MNISKVGDYQSESGKRPELRELTRNVGLSGKGIYIFAVTIRDRDVLGLGRSFVLSIVWPGHPI